MTRQPARRPAARGLLARILEEPELVSVVQALEPRTLHRLIDQVGLEDAGELVALVTTAQLTHLLDQDLWRSARPGERGGVAPVEDETFDPERFVIWLEVMLEAGDRLAARRLTELPEELVTLAFGRHLLVIDLDAMAVDMTERGEGLDDDQLIEKALDSCLCHEVAEYRLIARRHDGWDAIVTVLTALDEEHHDYLTRLLERLCALGTAEADDAGGLYQVLTSSEMLEGDAAADREDRRAREGYVAPSAAASFLALARTTELDAIAAARTPDPVTRAYFRTYAPPAAPAAETGERGLATRGTEAKVSKLVEALRQAETADEVRAPLQLPAGQPTARFRDALARLREDREAVYQRRMSELGYLVNVVLAGVSLGDAAVRPFEAVETVMATCNLGLERLGSDQLVASEGADKLFRAGWHILYREIVLPAAAAVERSLVERRQASAEPDEVRALGKAAEAVRAAVAAGKPWTVRAKLTRLCDAATLALLDECPTLLAADGRRELIATAAQLRAARTLIEQI